MFLFKLLPVGAKIDEEDVYINPEYVISVKERGTHTDITVFNGNSTIVYKDARAAKGIAFHLTNLNLNQS